jgi:hypothetical protein
VCVCVCESAYNGFFKSSFTPIYVSCNEIVFPCPPQSSSEKEKKEREMALIKLQHSKE